MLIPVLIYGGKRLKQRINQHPRKAYKKREEKNTDTSKPCSSTAVDGVINVDTDNDIEQLSESEYEAENEDSTCMSELKVYWIVGIVGCLCN